MRKIKLALAAFLGFSLAGCAGGPWQLQRSTDDWRNQVYVDSPWVATFLHIPIPFFPLVSGLAGTVDFWILNPLMFWGDDAWDSDGTAFRHREVEAKDGEVRSLMSKDGRVMKVYR